jgi:hypothetical protein
MMFTRRELICGIHFSRAAHLGNSFERYVSARMKADV